MWHWHGDGAGWDGGDWIGMALMMVFIWGPILLAGFFLLRASTGTRHEPPRTDSAEEEARRAYARGDIDRERFQQIIRDLRDHAAGRHG